MDPLSQLQAITQTYRAPIRISSFPERRLEEVATDRRAGEGVTGTSGFGKWDGGVLTSDCAARGDYRTMP